MSVSVSRPDNVGARLHAGAAGRGWWKLRGAWRRAWPRRPHAARPPRRSRRARALRAQGLRILEGQRLFERETSAGNGGCLHRTARNRHGLTRTLDAAPRRPRRVRYSSRGKRRWTRRRLRDGCTARGCSRVPRPACGFACTRTCRQGGPPGSGVTVRGHPTDLNTPALDPGADGGRASADAAVAGLGAITEQPGTRVANREWIDRPVPAIRCSARGRLRSSVTAPGAGPRGRTLSERRGRVFFEDLRRFSVDLQLKPGAAGACHSGRDGREQRIHGSRCPRARGFKSAVRSSKCRGPAPTFGPDQPHDRTRPPIGRKPGRTHRKCRSGSRRALSRTRRRLFHSAGSFDHLNAFSFALGASRTRPPFHDNYAGQ